MRKILEFVQVLYIKFIIWKLNRSLIPQYRKLIQSLEDNALESQRILLDTGTMQLPKDTLVRKNRYNRTVARLKSLDPGGTYYPMP